MKESAGSVDLIMFRSPGVRWRQQQEVEFKQRNTVESFNFRRQFFADYGIFAYFISLIKKEFFSTSVLVEILNFLLRVILEYHEN